MDCSLPGSSIHGIFQARLPEWVAIAFSTYTVIYMSICLDPGERVLGFNQILKVVNGENTLVQFIQLQICT